MPTNDRKTRLAAELRANLVRRKTQKRRADEADAELQGPDGVSTAAVKETKTPPTEDEECSPAAYGGREA